MKWPMKRKKATERIANMINYYRDNLQAHENN